MNRIRALAAVLILTTAPAFAQGMVAARPDAGPGMMGPGMMGQGMMGQGPVAGGMMPMIGMMGAPGSHVEGQLAFIKAELKITDVQMAQWNAFADVIRENAKSMSTMRQAMATRQTAVSLPERLARRDLMVRQGFAALKKTEDAVDKLYDVLSADQKKVADGIVLGPMGMPMAMM